MPPANPIRSAAKKAEANCSRLSSSPLERDPHAAAPIATAMMFVPAIMIGSGPTPVVRMHDHAEFRLVVIMTTHMPAIAIAVADDFRRGSGRACTQNTGAQSGGRRKFQ